MFLYAGQRVSQDALTSTTNHSKHQEQHLNNQSRLSTVCVFLGVTIYFCCTDIYFNGHYHVSRSYFKSFIYASDYDIVCPCKVMNAPPWLVFNKKENKLIVSCFSFKMFLFVDKPWLEIRYFIIVIWNFVFQFKCLVC